MFIEHSDKSNSDALANNREALAGAMHAIFGGLIHLYYKDLSKVEAFYELKYLRTSSSVTNAEDEARETLTISIGANSEAKAFQDILKDKDTIRVSNTGAVAFKVYSSVDVATIPALVLDVDAGQMVSLEAKVGDKVLVLKNENTSDAMALVELL